MKKQLHTILLLLIAFTTHSQTWQWGKRGGSTDNLSITSDDRWEEVIDMVTDSQKNIYILSPVGQALLNIDGNPKTNYGDSSSKTDFALSSFSCDGTYRWSKIIGGGGIEDIDGIEIDNLDNVYVSGTFKSCSSPYYARIDSDVILNTYTSASCKNLFIVKYSSAGNILWFKQPQALVTQAVANGQTLSRGLVTDNIGNSYWLCYLPTGTYADGAFVNNMSGTNLFILKYDTNGNFINATYFDVQLTSWFGLNLKFYRNINTGNFYITSFKSDATSTAVLGGQTVAGSGFIACFNELGQFQWKKESTNTTAGAFRFYGLKFDSSNNLYIAGKISGATESFLGLTAGSGINTPFIIKTDATADTVFWSTRHNYNGSYIYGAIALNGNEVGLAAYCFEPTFTWGSQTIFASNANEGTEVMLARFNKDTGACLGLHKIPGNVNYDDYGTALTVDASGDYILGGGFGNQLTINGNTLQNAGTQTDFFIAKFATSVCSPLSNEEFNLNEIKVYPNPVKDNLYWQGETGWTSYEVYSLLGQKVAQGKIEVGQNQINISPLTKGIYVLKCSDNSGNDKVFKISKE
ncbi:T9SS type A sorting domain-containing protein [Flavobacterium enshiense]|uniref:T9SS type A sorting domain-containing protein n=1 Tax=Flavobacterium enshiense TaxID=1341165 RepID=UPI00345C91AA